MSFDEKAKIVADISMKLGEHFDAVQILATWQEEGGTNRVFWGNGNWFARRGMMQHMLENENAAIQADHIVGSKDGGV